MDSLIARAQQQPDLIPTSEMDASLFSEAESDPKKAVYTAARLFAHRPETYKQCVSMLAEGIGILRIASILRMTAHTILAVREREAASITIEKERLARACLHGAQMCVEGIIEDMDNPERRDKTGMHQKAITMGILTEKHQLLTGGATSRMETVKSEPGHADFLHALASAIGCGGETAEQRSAGGPADAVAGARQVTDVESRVVPVEAPERAQGPAGELTKGGQD
jgi:hypothetical protein